ncbi:MAG: putative capsular polysaccharide synthesis family protein [Parvularculaceae bacterium]
MKPAIVYTMGKVGSDAVARALEKAGAPTHHIHTLDEKYILSEVAKAASAGALPAGHLCASMLLLQRRPANAVYVSSVRDPVARNLSAFFQNLGVFGLDESSSLDAVGGAFVARYNHKLPLNWFEREFAAHTGANVFGKSFDRAKRFAKGANWIVFRDDCDDAEKSRQLSALIGGKITVKRGNETGAKAAGALYARAKEDLKLPEALLDEIYGSAFARHFWTDDERSAMRARWR